MTSPDRRRPSIETLAATRNGDREEERYYYFTFQRYY